MTKKKLPSIAIDAATFAAMQEYAASSGLALLLPELVKRAWSLWMMIDQAHGTLYPHQLAGEKLDSSLEAFLDEMQEQADHLEEDDQAEESE